MKADLKEGLKDKKVSIQGLGNVGYHAAKFLQQEDECRIVCVIEYNGAILNSDGLDIEKIKQYYLEHGSFKGCPEGNFDPNTSELLCMECDILIPAAKENVIDESNAQEIKAKLIVEAANGPITFEADEILNKRNVTIIPDILANAGGVAVSYFEWIRNIRHIRFGRLEKRRNAFQFETLIAAIETMTGKDMPEKFKEQFIEGANEIDLVRSGLDDMMREAYQKVRQSMIENNTATRAEINDIATAIFQGADTVMLSAEAAIGKFPTQAVSTMTKTILSTEKYKRQHIEDFKNSIISNKDPVKSILLSVKDIAYNPDVKAIIVFSNSGKSAKLVSAMRPAVKIVTISPNINVSRQVSLLWGVQSINSRDASGWKDMMSCLLYTSPSPRD